MSNDSNNNQKNILVTSFGMSWGIIPELLGFTNPNTYNFYKNHHRHEKIRELRIKHDIQPVNEIWIATTNGSRVSQELEALDNWAKKINNLPTIHKFSYSNLIELDTIDEIAPMADLIFRVVLKAKEYSNGGKLYLSLAGGRKNMSANIQTAAEIFGCDALLHIIDDGKINDIFKNLTDSTKYQKMNQHVFIRLF